MRLADLISAERRRQRGVLVLACSAAVGVAASAVGLLGLSGWFLTSAALAGAAGAGAGFNYMLPAAGIRLLAIVRTLGRYDERFEGHRAALGALARIRPAVFSALAAAPPSQALALSTGEASARLVQDVDAVEILFVRISGRWGAVAALVAGVALAALADWRCGTALAGVFLLHLTAASILARWTALGQGRAAQRASGRLKDAVATTLAAAPEIAAYGLQDWAVGRIEAEGEALADARRAAHRAEGWQACLAAVMMAWAVILVLLLARHAPLPLAALATLSAAATMEASAGLVRAFLQDGAVEEAAARLDPLLGAAEATRHVPAPACVALTLREPGGAEVWLAPGQRLAVVGRSGCGKTTLLEQLVKLREVEPGRLTIGGQDLAGMAPSAARAVFAYAPQDPMLLAASVRENLELGFPGACETSLWAALADAGLDTRVRALPLGLDSFIGDAGERLSGGERRRLALARALLRPAPWLLLDEPTEGLDAATEALVIERLGRRLQRTRQGLILVSHRPVVRALCRGRLQLDTVGRQRAA